MGRNVSMKKLFSFLIMLSMLMIYTVNAQAIEAVRQKNTATYIVFPLIDSSDDVSYKSSAASLDSEIDAFADGSAPDGFVDCTNEATEIGSTGVYYLSLTQTEMNNDYIIIQVKASDANTQAILIRTMIGDAANLATTDDGGAINVTAGKIDEVNKLTEFDEDNTAIDIDSTTLGTVNTLTGHTPQTGDSYAIVNSGTYGNSVIEGLVDDLETRLTVARAGYLDKLNVTGTLANSDDAATYKAAGFSTHSAADVLNVDISAYSGAGYAGTYIKRIYDKLPANYIMGAGGQSDKDDDIDAILADTAAMDTSSELRTLLAGSDTALSTVTTAQVNSEVDTALADIGLDHLINSALPAGVSTDVALGSVFGELLDDGTAWSYDRATDSLEAIRDRGDSDWITSALAASDIWGYGTRTLTAFGFTADANLTQILGSALTETNTLADAFSYFFDVAAPSKTINDCGVAGSGLTAQEVWEYDISAISIGGYAGDYLNNLPNDPADDSDIDSQLSAIQTDLDNPSQYKAAGFMPDSEDGSSFTAIPWNAAWDAEAESEAIDALNIYGPPTKTELDTAVADVSVDELQASALADLFNTNSGDDYDTAAAGSVVKEIADNAGVSGAKDFTDNEATAIKAVLGVGDDDATPNDVTSGILDAIRDLIKRLRR